jgi:hypothetical protein
MRLYTVYLLLQTALHVSGSDATRHLEHIQLHSQHLVLVVVFELLPPIIVFSDHDSGRKQLLMMGSVTARNM